MFSSHKYLKRRTPCPGISRKEFIEHLVEEYYTTNNLEAQEQVTANLANFAYDPINWDFIKESDGIKLYLDLLATPNEILQQNGTAGLCNICLDKEAFDSITKANNLNIIHQLLDGTNNTEVILNCCLLIYYLVSVDLKLKPEILTGAVIKRVHYINSSYKSDKRVTNLCSLLLEEFCKRHEFVEKPN